MNTPFRSIRFGPGRGSSVPIPSQRPKTRSSPRNHSNKRGQSHATVRCAITSSMNFGWFRSPLGDDVM